MTTEMFGAPYGIQQAEQDRNQNILAGLKAQQLLDDISSAPLQRQLLASHAKLYAAQAAKAEAEAAEASGWQAFSRSALGGVGEGPVGPPAPGAPVSQATPLLQLGQLAARAGFVKQATTLLDKGTLIASHESAAASSEATRQLTAIKMQRAQMEMAGSAAAAAVDQPSYDRMRMSLTAQGKDVSWLPQDFESARPILEQAARESMKASEQLKAREAEINQRSLDRRRDVQNQLSRARIAEAGASVKLKQARTDAIVKNGGEGSPLAREAKQALVDSRRARQAQIERQLYPPVPAGARTNPNLLSIGQTYTLPQGRYTWDGKQFILFKGKPPASVAADIPDDTDEEDEE